MANYDVHTVAAKVSYDVCEKCGGLWLDKGELDKVADRVDGDIEYCSTEEVAGSAPDKPCPRCAGEHLHRVKFLGDDSIVLERCDNCEGFWLDGGQIEKIDAELAKIMTVKGRGFSEFLANTHLPHYRYIKRDSDETDFAVPPMPLPNARKIATTTHTCPVDNLFLETWEADGIQIESCPKCGGLWLHEKQLKALKDRTPEGNLRWMNDEIAALEQTSALVSDRTCPECKANHLVSTHFANSGIIIDRCDHCHGLWFDADEFRQMTDYLKTEADHETTEELKKKFADDVKRIWNDPSESKLAEVRDAESALAALVNASIFQHPALAGLLMSTGAAGRIVTGG